MSENPKFDEAIKDMLGDAVEYLRCPECNAEFNVCPKCGEAICPNFCEESSNKGVKQC